MELAHSLLLNEEALKEVPENKRSIFIYEWLRFLEKVLSAAQKVHTIIHLLNDINRHSLNCLVRYMSREI